MALKLVPVLRGSAGTALGQMEGMGHWVGHQDVVEGWCDVPLLCGMCLCAIPTAQVWFGAHRSCTRIQGVFQD